MTAEAPKGDLVRAQAAMDLAWLGECYAETKNPAAAWLHWHLARKWNMPVPQAISAEIERFAEGIALLATNAIEYPDTTISRGAVNELWGPPSSRAKDETRRGKLSFGEQLHGWFRNVEIAEAVYQLRTRKSKNGKNITSDKAVAEIAEQVELSEETVRSIANARRRKLVERDEGVDTAAQNELLDTLNEELRNERKKSRVARTTSS